MTTVWASVDGCLTPGGQAKISVFDRGFLMGDSVYEVLRTVEGEPLFWDAHLARLWESARRLRLTPPVSREVLRAEVMAGVAQMPGECRIRIIFTRGPTVEGTGSRVILCTPLILPDPKLLQAGCGLKIVRSQRRDEGGLDPMAKSGNKLSSIQAQAEATALGFYEALRVDSLDRVLECATSTFFMVRAGAVWTAPLSVGILAGITRATVLTLAQELRVEVCEQVFYQADLDHAEEAFITSSTRGVVPVNRIDSLKYVVPGAVTTLIQKGYDQWLRNKKG